MRLATRARPLVRNAAPHCEAGFAQVRNGNLAEPLATCERGYAGAFPMRLKPAESFMIPVDKVLG